MLFFGQLSVSFMCVLIAIYFLLRPPLNNSHKFWYIVFPLLFESRYLPISPLIFYLVHWLFKTVLFTFHVFMFSPVFLLH